MEASSTHEHDFDLTHDGRFSQMWIRTAQSVFLNNFNGKEHTVFFWVKKNTFNLLKKIETKENNNFAMVKLYLIVLFLVIIYFTSTIRSASAENTGKSHGKLHKFKWNSV